MSYLRYFSYTANNIDPYIPEIWAMESLAILEENMVAASLVHRDFSETLANFGDIVNTRRPAEFTAVRKTNDDDVTIQDATATNVQVPLDQHVHTSFKIKDGEQSKSMKDLFKEYLEPAVLSQARFVDQMVLGQYPQFLRRSGGQLGQMTSSNAQAYEVDLRTAMNVAKAPMLNRNLIVNPYTEGDLLNLGLFVEAQKVGDQGQALREAAIGRKFGFDHYMCQNMPYIVNNYASVQTTGAINLTAGYAAGYAGAMVVDGFSGAVVTGNWIDLDGVPYRISAHSETLGATTSITLDRPLSRAVANDAVIKHQQQFQVNFGAGYAAGYAKEIVIDTGTTAPQVGQIVSFGASASSAVYTVMAVTSNTGITLDRPLEVAIADDSKVNFGPPGKYNFAFLKNSIALVIRPLAMPPEGTGARAAVMNERNLSMRVTMTYDGKGQGTLVTLDFLCGIKVLDTNQGGVLLG